MENLITKGIIDRFYEAASIQRWNDHARPVEFTELDKQAHKMVIAYMLAKFEETERGKTINWKWLIEGGMFEFLHRVILTDIKPPVFHQMMKEKGPELNKWVLSKLEPDLQGIAGGFKEKFQNYYFSDDSSKFMLERRILQAAHYLATNWEFRIIYSMNPFIYGIEKTKDEIEDQMEDYYDLIGVQKIALGRKSFGFADLCGQLRFQQRWAQSPRLPKTSVLGHMLIVAMLSYLCSNEIGACDRRIYNNYFAGLFHDLPEVLTRDIVSPVKSSVEGLNELISQYEARQIGERLLPLLPEAWHEEIRFFIEKEFENKVKIGKRLQLGMDIAVLNRDYNDNSFNVVDGNVIRGCDHLAAFIETVLSINCGISSHHLEEGRTRLYNLYHHKEISGINFGKLFDYYELV